MPDELGGTEAGPLLCAGIARFNSLRTIHDWPFVERMETASEASLRRKVFRCYGPCGFGPPPDEVEDGFATRPAIGRNEATLDEVVGMGCAGYGAACNGTFAAAAAATERYLARANRNRSTVARVMRARARVAVSAVSNVGCAAGSRVFPCVANRDVGSRSCHLASPIRVVARTEAKVVLPLWSLVGQGRRQLR